MIGYVQTNTLYLAGSGVIIGATTITLTSLTDIYGNVLTMSSFGTKGYITLEPDTTNEEAATFTGITANANGTYTLTGIHTLLAQSPYTESSGLVRQHSGGTKVVVTDNVGFWNTFVNKENDATIDGLITFTQPPIGINPGGQPDASTTVKGIGKVSVAPVLSTNPIFVGDNDTRVPTAGEALALVGNNTDIAVGSGNKYVTQTGLIHNTEKYAADNSSSSTAYTIALAPIPTSYTTGMVIYAKIVNSNTTTTPTINVNGLGAKTIIKGSTSALVIGDIAANQFCTFIYDGTHMVLQNPTANTTTIIGNKIALSTASVTITNTIGNLFSVAIPGGTMGTGNAIRLKAFFTGFTLGASASAGFSVIYGGSAVSNVGFGATSGINISSGYGCMDLILQANGSTGSQIALGTITVGTNALNTSSHALVSTDSQGAVSVNSTASQNLVLQFSGDAIFGSAVTLIGYSIDLIS